MYCLKYSFSAFPIPLYIFAVCTSSKFKEICNCVVIANAYSHHTYFVIVLSFYGFVYSSVCLFVCLFVLFVILKGKFGGTQLSSSFFLHCS